MVPEVKTVARIDSFEASLTFTSLISSLFSIKSLKRKTFNPVSSTISDYESFIESASKITFLSSGIQNSAFKVRILSNESESTTSVISSLRFMQ